MTGAAAEQPTPPEVLEPPPYGPLPVGSRRRPWARRPPDDAEARALASSLRLQVLRLCLHEPRTNKELAAALGRNPATVLHHVRTLVDTGFLIEQPVRRGERGAREIPYLASGKSWYMDDGVPAAAAGQDLLLQTFLAEVARLPDGALRSTRLGFRLSPADRDELLGRLHDVLQEIADRPSDPDGEPFGLYVGLHPEPG
jgi:DNA-binding transcriptional ArsR family regulator